MNQLGEALVEFAGPAGTDLWRRPLALPAAHAAAQPAFPAAQPRAFQAPPQPHAFQAPPQAFQPPPQAFQPPKPTPAPFAPQAPAPEPTPLPAAKAGGTMMLTDELGNEIPMPQERGRRSAPRFTPRGGSRLSAPRGRRSTTGRRAPLAPAPRSSRFLAALAPAITLLFVAGAVVAVDRWGLDLWREHMPIVIPGSTADERPAREPPRPIEHPAAPAAPAPAPVAPAPHPAAPAPPPAAAAPARAERPEHVRKKKNRKGGHRRHYIHDAAALVPAEE
jgi:2-oxoglutarate dehydrogenase E2 component (dihydrolipoamide succinyltransferase)